MNDVLKLLHRVRVVTPLNPEKYVGNVCLTLRAKCVRLYLLINRALVFMRFLEGNTPKDEHREYISTECSFTLLFQVTIESKMVIDWCTKATIDSFLCLLFVYYL